MSTENGSLATRGDWPTTNPDALDLERSEANGRRRRLASADEELSGYYTAAIGVKAQAYEGSGGGGMWDANNAAEQHLRAMRWLDPRRGAREWLDAVAGTLLKLPLTERNALSLVYTPHGWPTWLADALSTPWGLGNFVALAATLPRATLAARRAGASSVLAWLASRGRGGANERESKAMRDLYRRLRDDCEDIRMPALAAYGVLRRDRVKREKTALRAAKADREAKSAALLEEELEMDRRIARARFERRMKKGRAA